MNAKLATLIVKVLDFIAEHPELEADFDIWRVGPERELRASFCYNYKSDLDALGMPVHRKRTAHQVDGFPRVGGQFQAPR